MHEGYSYNPSAEELYSGYKQAFSKLEEVKHKLPEAGIDTRSSIEYMDSIVSNANIDTGARQELLTKITEAKDISMKTRLRIRRINIVVAEHALESEEIISVYVYARKKDEWHEKALLEDELRSQQ